MLEQLDVQPGQRILEIGAGTGYNAALLAWLAGPAGRVTAIEIDADIAASARGHLAAAGYPGVSVFCGDGELGAADHGPYDRIIVTAGAWDLPPAWHEQLAPGGRLVVPFRMRGVTRSVAFERAGGHWRSLSLDELGFMPMRGEGAMTERNLRLGDVTLRIDDGQDTDSAALTAALASPPAVTWTGAGLGDSGVGDLDFWLADLGGFCRLLVTSPDAVGKRLVAPVYEWGSMGVYGRDCLTYLTVRSVGMPRISRRSASAPTDRTVTASPPRWLSGSRHGTAIGGR
jgi:protein-L-isoaspartate(D-aspartate) O-methyltransferase